MVLCSDLAAEAAGLCRLKEAPLKTILVICRWRREQPYVGESVVVGLGVIGVDASCNRALMHKVSTVNSDLNSNQWVSEHGIFFPAAA